MIGDNFLLKKPFRKYQTRIFEEQDCPKQKVHLQHDQRPMKKK